MTKYENLDFNGLEEALRTPSSGYRISYDLEQIKQATVGDIEYQMTRPHSLLNESVIKTYAEKSFKQEGLTKVVCIHGKNILSMMGRKDPIVVFVAVYEQGQSYECHQMRLTELYDLFY